ncbi:ankyrin-repeat containing protein [Synechococcus elongatus PCC 6311]|nr:ankyrin-repeat containing protein [Synechococcus elongatus PCC 7943]UOW72606.1 ankyrin-repeat containing protein [Synechococcus elongatus PCC 6311]UOW75327.1 ankyrin-repeat containing protein [Synechococcus elongatus PCC 6301]
MLAKSMRSLAEILQSCSDALFPAEMGRKKVDIHSTDCDGDTPLHVMVRRADFAAVLVLIEAGANVNAIGDMGETPLHIAVRQELEPIVEALLEAGSNPDIRSEFGQTPREQAAKLKGTIKQLFR